MRLGSLMAVGLIRDVDVSLGPSPPEYHVHYGTGQWEAQETQHREQDHHHRDAMP